MNKSIRKFVVSLLLVLGFSTPITTAGKPGSDFRPDLLLGSTGLDKSGLTNTMANKRTRLMVLNSSWLVTARTSGRNVQPGSKLRIQLFEGQIFDVVIERTKFRSKNRFLIRGRVENRPNSIVLLAFVDDALAGSVHIPGVGKFEIRFAGNGQHWVIEPLISDKISCGVEHVGP